MLHHLKLVLLNPKSVKLNLLSRAHKMMFKNNRLKLSSLYYSSINRVENSTQEYVGYLLKL